MYIFTVMFSLCDTITSLKYYHICVLLSHLFDTIISSHPFEIITSSHLCDTITCVILVIPKYRSGDTIIFWGENNIGHEIMFRKKLILGLTKCQNSVSSQSDACLCDSIIRMWFDPNHNTLLATLPADTVKHSCREQQHGSVPSTCGYSCLLCQDLSKPAG